MSISLSWRLLGHECVSFPFCWAIFFSWKLCGMSFFAFYLKMNFCGNLVSCTAVLETAPAQETSCFVFIEICWSIIKNICGAPSWPETPWRVFIMTRLNSVHCCFANELTDQKFQKHDPKSVKCIVSIFISRTRWYVCFLTGSATHWTFKHH